MAEIQYAVQPGNVTLLDGVTVKNWTAAALATAYGVQATPYLTINTDADYPKDPLQRMAILTLVPRADDIYAPIMYTAEDDGLDIAYRPDFDSKKKYIMETDPLHIYPDQESEIKLHSNS